MMKASVAQVVAAASVLLVLVWSPVSIAAGKKIAAVRASTPEAVITYAFLLSNYPSQFYRSLKKATPGGIFADFVRLNSSLDAINPDISNAIGFNYYSFVIQGDRVGQAMGFVPSKVRREEYRAIPDRGILFVTLPIRKLGDRVLMIVSSVGPDRTWILSVDKPLRARLLFDSLGNEKIEGLDGGSPMGSIYEVRVAAPDVFLLEERPAPPVEGGPVSPADNRVFRLDLSEGLRQPLLRLARNPRN